MKDQRGPKRQGDRSGPLGAVPSPARSTGPAGAGETTKSPVDAALPRSARWGDDDPILDEDGISHPVPDEAAWDDGEAITARRSVPRLKSHSASWEPVHPQELIPSVPPPPAAAAPAPSPNAPSVGPVAMDPEAGKEESIDFRRGVFPVRVALLVVALVAAVAALVLVVNPGGLGRPGPRASGGPVTAVAHARPEEAPVPPALPGPAADREPEGPPALTETGTILGSPDHRLYVDGRKVATWRADVKCGKHVVRNGSSGTERTVDVPCGGSVEVAP